MLASIQKLNVNTSISPWDPVNCHLSLPPGRCYAILGLSPSCVPGGGLLCHTGSLVLCIIITMYDILRNLHCAPPILQWGLSTGLRLARLRRRRLPLTNCDFNWIAGFLPPNFPGSTQWCCSSPTRFLFSPPPPLPPYIYIFFPGPFVSLSHRLLSLQLLAIITRSGPVMTIT